MDIKVFTRFDHIEHRPLRLYNAMNRAFNLLEDFGFTVFKEYVNQFSDEDKKDMAMLRHLVYQRGKAYTIQMVTRDNKTFDDEYIHHDLEDLEDLYGRG